MNFKRINNLTGWLVFAIATAVYALTVEQTASFWDCGEFIAASYKLQVPHPPGAPLFLLIGRLFSFLSFGDVTKVAYWINMVSVFSSSFSILFLFWTITFLAKKVIKVNAQEPTLGQTIQIIGSGLVGSLAYTFSDSFWFSAVEAEVYAISSFFTAFVFWAMLKWETIADREDSDKWLILIAYVMGLSIGAHLLNLVTIPALAYIFYFKKYKPTTKGILLTFAISGVMVVGILEGIIPGLPSIAGSFEIFFVNTLHLPFRVGIVFFMLLFIGALVYGIYYSIQQKNRVLNTVLVSISFVLIGYASYAVILIRSNYNPPIDENNPENVISFVSYLKREQYGDRPLIAGPQYTADLIDQKQGAALYRKKGDEYVIYDHKTINKFDKKHETIFPRMHSKQPGHIEEYEKYVGKPKSRVVGGQSESQFKPSFGQNLQFMFKYQFGVQYFRYFLWNFAGRENDIQGSSWLAPQDWGKDVPEMFAKNKARNNFYLIPLILGVLGFVFHMFEFAGGRDGKSFLYVMLFFLLTGLALSFYLNQPPVEPRERDYIFAGSFYVFAIWIGLGVIALCDFFKGFIKNETLRPIVMTIVGFSVPTIMAAQGWDDHDRSNRWHSVDSAKNLLNSCAKNAILFTGGDNDTFPLWYVQEVEGFRTDVRVCNLSLLNTDWYIEQMKSKAYDSQPLPIALDFENFIQGKNDYIPYVEDKNITNGIYLKTYIDYVKSENPAVMVNTQSGNTIAKLPSDVMILPIDTAAVYKLGIIPVSQRTKMVPELRWSLGKNSMEKKDLIILDMIATNNWQRPIYFSTTLSGSSYLNLKEYLQMEGLAYRLLPVKTAGASQGRVETSIMYQRMMKDFYWRSLDDETVYYDENYRRFPLNARNSFYRLAAEFYNEGNLDKAREVIDYCFKVMPDKTIPYDVYTPQFIALYLRLKEDKKALAMCEVMIKRADDELNYYKNNKIDTYEIQSNMYIFNQIINSLRSEGKTSEADKYNKLFEGHMSWVKLPQ